RIILARRARFLSAALFGIAGCRPADRPAAQPSRHDDVVVPPLAAATTTPVEVEQQPPPDIDHDRISDDADACPDVPGALHADPSRNGCPPVVVSVCLSIVMMPPRLEFAPNAPRPLPASTRLLEETANLMKQQSQLEIEIEGHTDSTERAQL